jgi:hypothetical protein
MTDKEFGRYTVPTRAGDIVVQLDDEEAEQRRLQPAEGKARTVPNKAEAPAKRSSATKRAAVVDKAFGSDAKKGPAGRA